MLQRYAVAVGHRMPLLGLELLLWATLFSLLLRRVLVTAVLGVAVGSINFAFARGWYSHLWGDNFWIAPELMVTTVAVALADLWLGVNWFREKRERRRLGATAGLSSSAEATAGIVSSAENTAGQASSGTRELDAVRTYIEAGWSASFFRPSRLTTVGRLVWQHWRESWRLAMILIVATMMPLVVICIGRMLMPQPPTYFWNYQTNAASYHFTSMPISFVFDIIPAFLGVSLLGLVAYHADQWGRSYRFLADRGAAPKDVWLSRQLVCWGSAAAALPALLVAALFLAPTAIDLVGPTVIAGGNLSLARMIATTCAAVVGYVVLSVAAGQLCSMFFHSGILAGLFSIILTLVLAGWCALMWLWQINWLWSMLPIPIALLLATRLRTRDWLVERNTFRAWLRPSLVLAIPTIALFTAVPLYRIYQIPLVDPGFSPEEFSRAMTAVEWAYFRQYGQTPIEPNTVFDPTGLLIDKAEDLQRKNKLDEALEQYLAAVRIAGQCRDWYALSSNNRWMGYSVDDLETIVYQLLPSWAAHSDQTPERLLAAQRKLEQITAKFSMSRGIKLRYLQLRQFVEGDPHAINVLDVFDENYQKQLAELWLRLPWERARCLRILNLRTRNLLECSDRVDREAKSGGRIWWPNVDEPYRSQSRAIAAKYLTLDKLISAYLLWDDNEIIYQRAAIETERRAVRIILVLEAWKLRHGSLPKTLDELIGSGLDRLPTDPYTGKSFLYFPEGVTTSFPWNRELCVLVLFARRD